jgi:asparagine synthetase B (glutamine-hydrolysing)
MCGIWAYLNPKKTDKDTATAYAADAYAADAYADIMNLTHRGPDHHHIEHISPAGLTLGFHRLAIMNTSLQANQPFKQEDPLGNTVILLCNGEIYNYKEVAEELGLPTPVNDCRLLLDLYLLCKRYSTYSFHCLLKEKVKGEFAFVLFELDTLKKVTKVIASRDPIGVRPLYVTALAPSSLRSLEPSSLRSLPSSLRSLEPSSLRYLAPSSLRSLPSLLFTSELKGALGYPQEIQEFPPGEWWEFEIDPLGSTGIRLSHRRVLTEDLYAPQEPEEPKEPPAIAGPKEPPAIAGPKEPPAPAGPKEPPSTAEPKDADALLRAIRTATVASIKRRLAADRPLAFLLSGGVDSSLVAAVSARLLGKPIRTFCCTLSENGAPIGRDVEYAREVAAWLGSDHTEVLFTKEEALAAIPDVIRTVESWDTTTVRASVGQYMVCRWIGQHTDCKVVLVGEGPDEVCSSYLFNWYAPSPDALDACAREYVKNIHLYDGRRADRCIARWGLEARVPFLDPEFIRAYWAVPAEERMPKTRGMEKWWLREAFRGTDVLPDRVRLRMKDAFSDSISGQVSWTQMIQQWIHSEGLVTDEELLQAPTVFPHQPPQTKEAYYYRKIFCDVFGPDRQTILPAYWQPKWNAEGQEVKGYVDPSARTLDVYSSLTTASSP